MKRTALRIGSLLLILVLLLGVLPTAALADEPETPPATEEFQTLWIFASYDGRIDEEAFFKDQVPSGTKIVQYLESKKTELEKPSYTFDGWYNYDSIDFKYKFDETDTVKGWTNVLVKYTSVKTVTFEYNNGMSPLVVPLTGNTVEKPTDPTYENHTFLGWFTEDDKPFSFSTPVTESLTLYAHWVANPQAQYLVKADFPSRVVVGTYRDASVSLSGVLGASIYSGARLEVSVSKPSHAEAQLWYDLDSSWWWDYVDVAARGYLFRNTEIDEMTLMNFPLSLYVDKAGTYTFTFTLYDGDGVALTSDTATVKAYPAEEDYRVYIDAGKHGTVTVSDRYAAKGDRVIIYATPDKGYELDTLKVYDAWGDRVDVYAYGSNYAFTMPRSAVKVVATFTDAKYGHFTDVPTDSWYYDAVYYVYNHDIMDGIGNRTFNPYGDLSRAMIVTTLYRLEGEPGVRTSGSFRDVPDNTWYSSAVEWAAKEGIVKGYGKKTFKPSESVTVEQLAAILQRYADYKGYDIDETVRLYADAVVSQWAVNNVRWAAAEGLLRDGRSTNGTLVATRAEIAYALYGFMVNVAK